VRWVFLLLGAITPMFALAQFSGNAALLSDYRFRGVSLSADRSAAQLDIAFDFEQGAYSGLFLSNTRFADRAPERAQVLAYGGYARRLDNGTSIDAGAGYSAFPGVADYNYGEVHVGFSKNDMSARIYYAPNYFGQRSRTVYSEFNARARLADGLNLLGHAGTLVVADGPAAHGHIHADANIALEYSLRALRMRIGRVICDGAASTYPVAERAGHGAWTARISASF
jgi:uncharacterized protein (TIGR02001 family)